MKSNEEYRNSIDEKVDRKIRCRKQRNRYIAGISSFVTCLVLTICAVTILPNLTKNPILLKNPDSSYDEVVNTTDSNINSTPETSTLTSKSPSGTPDNTSSPDPSSTNPRFQTVTMNVITGQVSGARRYFDPQKTYKETWTWDKITSYLGHDITPSYVMPGLKKNTNQNEQMVILNNDGTLAYDAIWLEYYIEYEDDGSQGIGFGSTGIRIIASKLGYSNDCVYVWPSDLKENLIDGASVKLGYRKMEVGGTAEKPESYYDLYVAEFIKDGISYQVVSSNISENEFVKMVASLIS